ncbi:MAG: OmpA family protein [Bryocella sp.]
MRHILKSAFALPIAAALALACLPANAQEPNPTAVAPGARSASVIAQGPDGIYVYHVKVVERTLDAVNYLNRRGDTKIEFRGTNLLPGASGEARVESVTGKTKVSARFRGLTPANGFGHEYLTYVIWAISVDGRPQNMGELELSGNKANLDFTVPFQSFGMIVTAEPYYSVSTPSDVVVLQNYFTDQTQGILKTVNVHYSLLPKGLYAPTSGADTVPNPISDRGRYPLWLAQAHNADRIAKSVGAEKYAPEIMKQVAIGLQNADAIQNSKRRDVKMEATYAREATQRAEDARLVTLRKQAAERAQNTRDDAARAKEAAAQSKVDAANAQAQADASAAAKARADAQRARAEADAANARARAAQAEHSAQKSEASAEATREKLRAQLNSVLATTESARGLIVNMSDVLFDTGKYTIKQDAQLKLAKVATILQLYPGLKVQVEGYTDNVGGDEYNQKLSENRANAVDQFLAANGVPQGNVTAQGFGKADTVADNSTAAGRAQNRRVNLVVTGDAIGIEASKPQQ